MNNTEQDFINTIQEYLKIRNQLDLRRDKLQHVAFSVQARTRLASIIADHYDCRWYETNQGGISFCDDLDRLRDTRRHDAIKFWRRLFLGQVS